MVTNCYTALEQASMSIFQTLRRNRNGKRNVFLDSWSTASAGAMNSADYNHTSAARKNRLVSEFELVVRGWDAMDGSR